MTRETNWEERWSEIDQLTWLERSQHPEPAIVKDFFSKEIEAAEKRGAEKVTSYIEGEMPKVNGEAVDKQELGEILKEARLSTKKDA